ncbi:MAG TPA: hypothetical protein VN282_24480 [Pyrinomonadaceae bacterium]|nr:hypothetical protein [Pyrinomonadaceae bacterium]
MVDTGFQTNQDLFGMDDDTRAMKIVNGIFRDDADVVVLNEAFNEKGMDRFVELLKGKYPSYVRMVDEPDSSDSDSGLMLFSKFKFDVLHCGQGVCATTAVSVEAYNEGLPWNHNNSRLLETNGSDAWANKAVTLIRIINECDNNKPFAVVFTHTQASYKDTDNEDAHEDFVDRQKNFDSIKDVITGALTPEELSRERVFVLGDLNVNGNLLSAGKVPNGKGGTESFIEWDYTFGQYARDKDIHDEFFACKGPTETCTFDTTELKGPYLVDSWGYESSPADPGQTNSGSDLSISLDFPQDAYGERLDYILHNKPAGDGLCMQWIARAYELGDPPPGSEPGDPPYFSTQLSDHLGVKADFNLPFFRCTPREKNVPGGGGENGSEPVKWLPVQDPNFSQDVTFDGFKTGIVFPGSMQWYKVNEKGTFSIATSKSNVAFEVYQERDLSRPVNFFHGEMHAWGEDPIFIGKTYKFSEPPYYVRVFPVKDDGTHDRAWVGLYMISFHKHLCKSLADRCMLRAGELEEYEWPDTLLKPEDKLYYRFYADTLSNGKAPKIRFFIETSATVDSVPVGHVELLTADAATAIPWFHTDSSWSDSGPAPNGKKDMRYTAPDTVKGDPCAPAKHGCSLKKPFTLRVGRSYSFEKTAFTVGMRYETSLNYFRARNLVCIKQNTDVGDDDIWENFKFDSPNAMLSPCLGEVGCTLIGWFDTGQPLGISHLRGKYEDNVVPNLWEDEDNPGEGGHEYLSPMHKKFIGPLPVDFFKKGGSTFHWGTWPDDADETAYWYAMTYEVSHEQEEVP